jgi:hypothetical protein
VHSSERPLSMIGREFWDAFLRHARRQPGQVHQPRY